MPQQSIDTKMECSVKQEKGNNPVIVKEEGEEGLMETQRPADDKLAEEGPVSAKISEIATKLGLPVEENECFSGFLFSHTVQDAVFEIFVASYRGYDFNCALIFTDAHDIFVSQARRREVGNPSANLPCFRGRDALVKFLLKLDSAPQFYGPQLRGFSSGSVTFRFEMWLAVLQYYLDDIEVDWAWRRYAGIAGPDNGDKDWFWQHWEKNPMSQDDSWDEGISRLRAAVAKFGPAASAISYGSPL